MGTYISNEDAELFLNWFQSDADKAGIAEYFEEARAVAAKQAIARRIASTDTVSERGAVRMQEAA